MVALETLEKLDHINGVKILRNCDRPKDENGNVDWRAFDELRKAIPISIDDDQNMISFKIQNGPIKENGVNGCQVDEIVIAAREIIAGLNAKFPCRENSCAITKLDEAIMWLRERKRIREARGVEGKSEA